MMGRVHVIQGKFRYYLDNLKLQVRYRWIATFILACFYALRAYLLGCYLLTYTLGMILSNFVSFFLFTAIDPDDLDPDDLDRPVSSDAPPILPIKNSDELRPFVPFFPEFNFWCCVNVVLCVALGITFIPIPRLPLPIRWYMTVPMWLLYNVRLLIEHSMDMDKYKYIPFYYGDKKQGEYKGK